MQVPATSPAARRYIISFSCTGAFDIEAAARPSLHSAFNSCGTPCQKTDSIASPDAVGCFPSAQGRQWVRLEVLGQSFMMHQIRRMVGMALSEFRGAAPTGCLQLALDPKRTLDVRSRSSTPPPSGLLLPFRSRSARARLCGMQRPDLRRRRHAAMPMTTLHVTCFYPNRV